MPRYLMLIVVEKNMILVGVGGSGYEIEDKIDDVDIRGKEYIG